MIRRVLSLASGVAVLALPVLAEEEDDGIEAFFTCVDAVEWAVPTTSGYAEASPAQHCFDALDAAVPGWCPLMDNQIRTRQGDALFAAAAELIAPGETKSLFINGIEWTITPDPDFGTSSFEDCPGVVAMSVAQGVSKEAICHQQAGWASFSVIRYLAGPEGGS
ncbi:MAG: hypothetical protein AAFP28_01415 [Pseudomonadota bacterium]